LITSEQITAIIRLLEAAGREIMIIYNSDDFGTSIKEDNSPVTKADFAADRIIKEGLKEITPGVNVFSEETKDVHYSVRSKWEPLWILDPIDGTREFIARNGEFCISLALSSGHKIVAGFIYSPVTGDTWYSLRGKGAWKEKDGKKTKLPLVKTEGAYQVNISRSHFTKNEELWIDKLRKFHDINIEIYGSAVKFCKLAEGVSDIYPKFSRIHEWDMAAGQLILEESGGVIVEAASLQAPVYNKESYYQPSFVAFSHRINEWRKLLDDLNSDQT
jgi:3'(2'), 5'-bisphosphate nucleotidase